MPPTNHLQVVLAVFDRTASELLATHLRKLGCTCRHVDTLRGCQDLLRSALPDLILAELGEDAVSLELVTQYAAVRPVIALALPYPELFFLAAKAGVDAVLQLPLTSSDYPQKLSETVARLQQLPGNLLPHSTVTSDGHSNGALHTQIPSLFATSDEMAEVRETIAKVAPTNATVLIRGESGVGKELAARLIHSRSARAERAFVKVNCAAIPNELLESELFGYEAGAFTGAVKRKPGKFELADGGTIFLDEIAEMHPMLQAKLLHVLQDGDFSRLGSRRDVSVNVRVICATNQFLDQLVAAGKFREDLFYRINVVTIRVPPLRERKAEIPILLEHFLRLYERLYGKPAAPFDQEVLDFLLEYDWPGNIRELENLCKRYVIVGGARQILREMKLRGQERFSHQYGSQTPFRSERSVTPLAIEQADASLQTERVDADGLSPIAVDRVSLLEIGRKAAWIAERAALEQMLGETHWNRREAARRLNISYKALLNKIQAIERESQGP